MNEAYRDGTKHFLYERREGLEHYMFSTRCHDFCKIAGNGFKSRYAFLKKSYALTISKIKTR